MRRLRRHMPDGLHHLHGEWRRSGFARPAEGALAAPRPGALCRRRAQDRARHGEGRRRLPALRAVRRALPHRRLGHAKVPHRYDLRGINMPVQSPISSVNDFVVRFANVNGSGSASANELFARSILRHGVPVSPRNIFPSNIQGLPTWYEVRVTEAGHLGARGGVDLMVAMNPQTWDKDVASIEPGGYLFYDSTKPMPSSKFRADISVIGVPLTAIANSTYTDPRQRRSPPRSPATARSCGTIPKPARRNTPSCKARTNWLRSGSSLARHGTARAPSRPPPVPASR